MNLELQLPPYKTALIQLLARIGGATVGSPITGVPDGVEASIYRFALSSYSTGDYNVQLSGVSTPNGVPFPMRNGVAYPGFPWPLIDATIYTPPVIAQPTVASVCRVQLVARRGAIVTPARVLITCGLSGRLAAFAFANNALNGSTDQYGVLVVDLPWSSLPGVGKYRFRLIDIETGLAFHDRTVTVPDELNATYGDLT